MYSEDEQDDLRSQKEPFIAWKLDFMEAVVGHKLSFI